MERARKTWLRGHGTLLAVMIGALVCLPLAVGATTGKNGYDATRQIDTLDADAVTLNAVRHFNPGGDPGMAVDSNGTVYVVATTVDTGGYGHDEVLAFTPGASGGTGLRRVLGVRMLDMFVRSMLVVPEGTTDSAGDPLLVKDHLLFVMDGYDTVANISWREIWQVDPSAPTSHAVLYSKRPEPTRGALSMGGTLVATVATDGDIYLQEEFFSPNIVNPGSIRKLSWSDTASAYVEASAGVTSNHSTTGWITVGPDGFLYGFENIAPVGDTPRTDRILRIDPDGNDNTTTYADFSGKFGERHPANIALAFDSEGQLWLQASVSEKGRTVWLVTPVDPGVKVGAGGRIAEAPWFVKQQFAAGPGGTLYVIEREVDNPSGTPDLDAIYELKPGSGGGGGGGGGGGNGGGKGKNK